jgi:hypothetical protein
MNKIIKLTTLLLSLMAAITFTNAASATVTPNGGENWGGTQGINTPDLWTQGHGNVVGSHFMRMSMQDGTMKMDPGGMLMQHHFANHGATGASNPGLQSNIMGAMAGADTVSIDLDNFVDPSFGTTRMRVEVLSFNDDSDTFASIGEIIGTDSGSVEQTSGPFDQADATWTDPGGMESTWDYTYSDFVLTGAASQEKINIDANGTNIGQVFVWTEQIAGDVAPVPVPAAVWLFGSAMAGLFSVSRRSTKAKAA